MQATLAVAFDHLPAWSAPRTVAISGLVSAPPRLKPPLATAAGALLGEFLLVELRSGSGAVARLVCVLEGCRR